MSRAIRLPAAVLLAALLAFPAAAQRLEPTSADPLGVAQAHLDAQHWIGKLDRPNRLVMDAEAIEAQNRRLRSMDPTWNDLESLPQTLEGERITAWIQARSSRPQHDLYDEEGKQGNERQIDRLVNALHLGAIPQAQVTRFGLVVRRAALRRFPTHLRVFRSAGDTDIDRFQETALFPGTPVVIAHDSRDRRWWFVVSPLYTGWVEKDAIAEGTREEVFGYVRQTPVLVATGADVRTAYVPRQPALSRQRLDMGTAVPRLADAPPTATINGQLAYAAWPVRLPQRTEEGRLAFSPALVPRSADAHEGPLPFTRANVLRQSFKFLGERYGWGHDYEGRDCSGFVSEVYRSMGLLMPRNTIDQAASPAFERTVFDATSTTAQRNTALRGLQVGDLVYIPGHVMMVVGRERGDPWVIHDVHGVSVRNPAGELQRLQLNAVSVTPLLPLRGDDDVPLTEKITAIVRMRPAQTGSRLRRQ